MTSVTKTLFALFMVMAMSIAHADTSKTFSFENQREESFDLENWLKETRYKTETVDSTCYRQEPYVENVCRNVTRYRQECETVPGENVCRQVNDPICRSVDNYENECHMERGEQSCRVVVNYRQECSTQGGGRQCRTIPGDVQCHREPNGENRCVKIPPREECSDSPGHQVCRQVPYEERECSNGPDRQVCRQVNYPRQECRDNYRQECEYIPAHRECSQVPYYEEVCADETLYRQVPYACKKDIQVPYDVTLKTHQANVQVLFDAKSSEVASEFNVALDNKGEMNISAKAVDGSRPFIVMKKDIKKDSAGDINTIKAVYNLSLFNLDDFFKVSNKGISDVTLGKRAMSFVVNGKFDHSKSSLAVKIAKKDDVKFEKTLKPSQFKAKYDGVKTIIDIDLESVGAPKLGGLLVFNKKYQVTLKLKLNYSDAGEILLPKLDEASTATSVEVELD